MPEKNICRIGLLAVGLEAYWKQFPLLKDRLEKYLQRVYTCLKLENTEIIFAGLVDSSSKAAEAGSLFKREDVDIIFLYVPTYALSANILPAVQRVHVPVIILNLSPEDSIDYQYFHSLSDRSQMTGEWLANCSTCTVPELILTFRKAGLSYHLITGTLTDDEVWAEAAEWIEAANVSYALRRNRLGCMGHYYSGMLDMYTDLTQIIISFGVQIEMIEVDELSSLRKNIPARELSDRMRLFQDHFDIAPDCSNDELEKAALTSVALDKMATAHELGSLTYYYKGSGNPENEETMSSIIPGNSLLTARGIPVAGEYDIKNAIAMKIMDCFHSGGSFTEFYAMDYTDDIVLMGHDGPGHMAIGEGKTKLKPLSIYHGKTGNGMSVEMSVKNGPVTLLSVVPTADGRYMLLVAEGESMPGPILEIGNTNSRYKFSIGAKSFVNNWCNEGPAHHCAVGLGHIAGKIRKLGKLLNLPVKQVC